MTASSVSLWRKSTLCGFRAKFSDRKRLIQLFSNHSFLIVLKECFRAISCDEQLGKIVTFLDESLVIQSFSLVLSIVHIIGFGNRSHMLKSFLLDNNGYPWGNS